jgi:cell division protein FtsN
MTKTVPPQTLPTVKPAAKSVATVQPKAPLPSQPMTKTVPPQTLPAIKPLARSSAPATILPVSKQAGQPVKTFRRPAVPDVFKNTPPELKLGIYTISIGAFPTEAEAIRFKQPYVRKGYVAINWKVTVDGKSLYRVVVGRFNTSRDAQRAIKAAKHDLPKDSWVVPIESDYTHF